MLGGYEFLVSSVLFRFFISTDLFHVTHYALSLTINIQFISAMVFVFQHILSSRIYLGVCCLKPESYNGLTVLLTIIVFFIKTGYLLISLPLQPFRIINPHTNNS